MASYCDTGMELARYFQLEGRGTPEAKATELHLLRTAFRLKRRRLHRVRGRLQIADSRLGARRLQLSLRRRRVLDAWVVDAAQRRLERLPDRPQVAQRQVALVQLPLAHARGDHAVDQRVDSLERAVFAGADDGFHGIGQHYDRRFPRLRARARVTEPFRVCRRVLGAGLAIEVGD